jgi:hypothetical protein
MNKDNYLEAIRTADLGKDELRNLLDELNDDEKEIDIPDKSQIFTDRINVPDEITGNINVNGHWVHPIYAKLANMLEAGQSPIVIVVGKEGKGKSMTANVLLWYCHNKLNLLRGDYNPESQVVYRPLEFLMLERDSTRTGMLFDEANETLNSNDFHSKFNSAVAGAVRTQRKRENLRVFVGPDLNRIDSRIRKKADFVVEMKSKQFAKVTSYETKHGKRENSGLDYNFTKYPHWAVPDLDKNLLAAYEKVDNQYKGEYLDELLKGVINERIDKISESETATF